MLYIHVKLLVCVQALEPDPSNVSLLSKPIMSMYVSIVWEKVRLVSDMTSAGADE